MSQEKSKYYYITTPIYYVNGLPHVGSAYTTALADSLMRFHKFLGKETFFLTGTDEHGDKLKQAADAAGKTPIEYVNEISEIYRNTWKEFGFEFSRFIRTTDSVHKKVVHQILEKLHKQGDIYFGEYGGNYCYGCERFLTDKELVNGECPDHQKPTTYIKEQNYFFKMSKYQDQLLAHIEKNPDFIRPERYRNEVISMLKSPLDDLCISRPKSRLTWGIELPFDSNYVTYVWFDALINYLTGIDYPDGQNFEKYWQNCDHLIAKDILKPHGVFWPTMLLASGLPLYQHLNVHGYWVTPQGKMSKSLGNVLDPKAIRAIRDTYGMDVFRYFVFREMAFGLDGTFNYDALETRYNADLANNLGNLVSRSIAMVEKYRGGIVPSCGTLDEISLALKNQALETIGETVSFMENVEIHRALEKIWSLVNAANVYIDRTKPWALAKEEKTNAEASDKLNAVLYCQLEVIRVVANLIGAFMPETSVRILKTLGYNESDAKAQFKVDSTKAWGTIKPGQKLEQAPALFPRIDNTVKPGKTMEAPIAAPNTEIQRAEENIITYDDFAKVDLRVAQILEAQKVEKSDKLIKLQIDLGAVGQRQIVAGIGKRYTAEELVGRKIIVVTNLKPAKLMGQESRGMLLAASDDDGGLELLSVDPIMPAGSQVR